jgi:hypothetical protein
MLWNYTEKIQSIGHDVIDLDGMRKTCMARISLSTQIRKIKD